MISVAKAQAFIEAQAPVLGTERIPLEAIAGHVLAQDVFADRDGPPYDRVTMDGIAVDSREGLRSFSVAGFQAAGGPPLERREPGTALEVATGAVLPKGCDAVAPYEMLELESGIATLSAGTEIRPGQHIHRRGEDYQKGALLISKGALLRSPHAHLLATVGLTEVLVHRHPVWALAATGDEVVDPSVPPEPHQIRRSNTFAIRAEAAAWGLVPSAEMHLLDEIETLVQGIETLSQGRDALVLSGGVSRGARDLVPAALDRLGAREVFHRVAQRPGKPFWFGVLPSGTRVFGLPGNPLSSLVIFRRYVLPALMAWSGRALPQRQIRVTDLAPIHGELSRFILVQHEGDRFQTAPEGGSGDLRPMAVSTGFVQLDPGGDPSGLLPYFPWGLPGGDA